MATTTTIVLRSPSGFAIPISLEGVLQQKQLPKLLTPFLLKGNHLLDDNLRLDLPTKLSENWFIVLPGGKRNVTVYDIFAVSAGAGAGAGAGAAITNNWRVIKECAQEVYGTSFQLDDDGSDSVVAENCCYDNSGKVSSSREYVCGTFFMPKVKDHPSEISTPDDRKVPENLEPHTFKAYDAREDYVFALQKELMKEQTVGFKEDGAAFPGLVLSDISEDSYGASGKPYKDKDSEYLRETGRRSNLDTQMANINLGDFLEKDASNSNSHEAEESISTSSSKNPSRHKVAQATDDPADPDQTEIVNLAAVEQAKDPQGDQNVLRPDLNLRKKQTGTLDVGGLKGSGGTHPSGKLSQLPVETLQSGSSPHQQSNSSEGVFERGNERSRFKYCHVAPGLQSTFLPHQQLHPDDISFDSQVAFPSDSSEDQAQANAQIVERRKELPVYPHAVHGRDNLRQTLEQQGRGVSEMSGQYFRSSSLQVVPNVRDFGFLDISAYQRLEAGTIIFSRETNLTVGLSYSLPNKIQTLGQGGNGKVMLHSVNQKVYAVKKTLYRSKELNSWLKLEHDNLIPLLAVMIDPLENCCYQFMPKMRESLNSVLRYGVLVGLSNSSSAQEWNLISTNTMYILKCVLNGLKYLEGKNMQHCDVKASNVLIGYCPCKNILLCSCHVQNKFRACLADFDSMKETEKKRIPAQLPRAEFIEKRVSDKILGTPGHRAPEQFVSLRCPDSMYKKNIMDGRRICSSEYDCGGPWCDMWSFGVMTSRVCLGKPMGCIFEANSLLRCPSAPVEISHANEIIFAFVVLYRLTEVALSDENLKSFAILAIKCVDPKFRDRPSARELLEFIDREL